MEALRGTLLIMRRSCEIFIAKFPLYACLKLGFYGFVGVQENGKFHLNVSVTAHAVRFFTNRKPSALTLTLEFAVLLHWYTGELQSSFQW